MCRYLLSCSAALHWDRVRTVVSSGGRRAGIVLTANLEIIYAMRIAILALDGLFDTGLTVLLDAFRLANNFAGLQTGGTSRFDLSIVGVRRRVRSGQGLSMPVQAITPRPKPDWVIVPALGTGRPE